MRKLSEDRLKYFRDGVIGEHDDPQWFDNQVRALLGHIGTQAAEIIGLERDAVGHVARIDALEADAKYAQIHLHEVAEDALQWRQQVESQTAEIARLEKDIHAITRGNPIAEGLRDRIAEQIAEIERLNRDVENLRTGCIAAGTAAALQEEALNFVGPVVEAARAKKREHDEYESSWNGSRCDCDICITVRVMDEGKANCAK